MTSQVIDLLRYPGHKIDFCLAACIGTDKRALADMLHTSGVMDLDTAVIAAQVLVNYRARSWADALRREMHHSRTLPRVAYAVVKDVTEHDMKNTRLTAVQQARLSAGLWAWADGVRTACMYAPDNMADVQDSGVRAIADYLMGVGRTGADDADYYWATLVMAHNHPHYDGTDRTFDSEAERVAYCLRQVNDTLADSVTPRFGKHLGRSNAAAVSRQARYELRCLLEDMAADWHDPAYFTAMIGVLESGAMPQFLTIEDNLTGAYDMLDDETAREHDYEHRVTLRAIRDMADTTAVTMHADLDYLACMRRAHASKIMP